MHYSSPFSLPPNVKGQNRSVFCLCKGEATCAGLLWMGWLGCKVIRSNTRMIRDAGLQPGRGADTRTRLKTRGRGDTPNIWSRLTSPAQPIWLIWKRKTWAGLRCSAQKSVISGKGWKWQKEFTYLSNDTRADWYSSFGVSVLVAGLVSMWFV